MEQTAAEIKRLKACINDLISLLALPAIWSGAEPSQILGTLLDVLLGILRLDFAYARLSDTIGGGSPIEMVRLARHRDPITPLQEIGRALTPYLGVDPRTSPLVVRNPVGEGDVSIVSIRLGLQDEVGVLVAGSQRAGFPTDTEKLLLGVAANQAVIGLQEARLLSDQRRVAEQIEQQERQAAVLEERTRIAREIHDTLAQAFTGILLQLGAAERLLAEDPGRGLEHIAKARDAARDGLEDARRSVQALRPQALEETDLAAALGRMAEQSNTGQGAQIQFLLRGSPRPLPPDVANNLLRICQEALTNALRHAQANEIRTELTFADEELHLCVKDDGCGFATDDGLPRKGYGLSGMHERAGIIGAHLAVTGRPGSGTCVELPWRFPPG